MKKGAKTLFAVACTAVASHALAKDSQTKSHRESQASLNASVVARAEASGPSRSVEKVVASAKSSRSGRQG